MFLHSTIKSLFDCAEAGLGHVNPAEIKRNIELACQDPNGNALLRYVVDSEQDEIFCHCLQNVTKKPHIESIESMYYPNCTKLLIESAYYPQIAAIYANLPEQTPKIEQHLISLNEMFLMRHTKACDIVVIKNRFYETKKAGKLAEPMTQTEILKLPPIDFRCYDDFCLHALEPDFLQWAGAHWPTKKRWDKIFHSVASVTFLKMHPELAKFGIKAVNEF